MHDIAAYDISAGCAGFGSELIREGRKEPSTPNPPPVDARSREEAQAAADVEAARRLLSDANKRLRKIRADKRSERT